MILEVRKSLENNVCIVAEMKEVLPEHSPVPSIIYFCHCLYV